jgi:regulator of RNase E activity RraA
MIDPAENGIVSIPQSKLEEVLELLPRLVAADEKVIADVERGSTVADAFKKHRSNL